MRTSFWLFAEVVRKIPIEQDNGSGNSERSSGLVKCDAPKRFRFLNAEQFGTILAVTPLLSDSSPVSGRIRRNTSVKYYGKIPSNFISRALQSSGRSAGSNRQLHKRSQLFICTHNVTLPVAVMRVDNPDRSPVGIDR